MAGGMCWGLRRIWGRVLRRFRPGVMGMGWFCVTREMLKMWETWETVKILGPQM